MIVAEALAAAGIEPREARLLLAEVAGFSQAGIVAASAEEIPFEVENAFLDLVEQRKRGVPVAYLLGRKEFYGLPLIVDPCVLIPRPETELLVERALDLIPSSALDLGTGSGAVALAIKHQQPHCKVTAVDADLPALQIAKRNATKLGLDIEFGHGRWFGPVAGRRFDVIVSNPPYIAEGDPHLPALRFEPSVALLAGPDGLAAYRELIPVAPAHLRPAGWLLLEHGMGQEFAVRALLEQAGFSSLATWPDLSGIGRVTGGKL